MRIIKHKNSYRRRKGKRVKSHRQTYHKKKVISQSSIISEVSKKSDLKRGDVKKVYDNIFDLTKTHLKGGKDVRLDGLGTLVVKVKKARPARKGINPFTQKEQIFKAKPKSRVIRFRPSRELK